MDLIPKPAITKAGADKPTTKGLTAALWKKITDFRVSTYDVKGQATTEISHIQGMATKWSGTLFRFGLVAGCAFIFLSDWSVIAARIPFYNQKFEEKK